MRLIRCVGSSVIYYTLDLLCCSGLVGLVRWFGELD